MVTRGSGLASVYGAALTFIIAANLGLLWLAGWAAVWSGLVFRAASNRRNRGGYLKEAGARSDEC